MARSGANALKAAIAALRTRLAARPDSEHEQALVRLVLGTFVLGYLLVGSAVQEFEPTVYVMAGYLAVAAVILWRIVVKPTESPGCTVPLHPCCWMICRVICTLSRTGALVTEPKVLLTFTA